MDVQRLGPIVLRIDWYWFLPRPIKKFLNFFQSFISLQIWIRILDLDKKFVRNKRNKNFNIKKVRVFETFPAFFRFFLLKMPKRWYKIKTC